MRKLIANRSNSVFALVFAFAAFALAAVGAQGVHADDGSGVSVPPPSLGDLPGGLSIESAVKQVDAGIEDWKDELTKSESVADHDCGVAAFWHGIFPWIYKPIAYPTVLDVDTLMNEKFQGVSLTPDENDTLDAILAHAPESKLDQIEIEIGMRDLAMKVANRSYAAAIEVLKPHSGAQARCEEMGLRVQRDNRMIEAAQSLIDAYDRYDVESTNVINGVVNGNGGGSGGNGTVTPSPQP